MPDRVKPSFVIFDIRALWRSAKSVRVPGCQNNYKRRPNPVWHKMLCNSCSTYSYGNSGREARNTECRMRAFCNSDRQWRKCIRPCVCLCLYERRRRCNTVRWAWLAWGLSGWLTTLLRCFDTVGWVIRPLKTVGRITYIVLVQT